MDVQQGIDTSIFKRQGHWPSFAVNWYGIGKIPVPGNQGEWVAKYIRFCTGQPFYRMATNLGNGDRAPGRDIFD